MKPQKLIIISGFWIEALNNYDYLLIFWIIFAMKNNKALK